MNMREEHGFDSAALVVVAVAVVMLLAPPAVAGTWQGKESRKDGVVTVMNPSEPADEPMTQPLAERWRAEGDSDDFLFGILTDIASDAKGNIYLLDMQLNEVLVFSPDGEYVRSIGREGQGPGEFNNPSGLFLTADGNVAVLQRMPGKIVLLTPDGMPAGNYPLPESDGMRMFNAGEPAGDALVLNMMRFKRNDEGMSVETSLVCVNSEGEQTANYLTRADIRDFSNMEVDEKSFGRNAIVWAASDDGRVFASNDFDAYRIHVWNADGTLDRVIERDYEPRMRTEKEIEDATPRIRIRGQGGRGGEMKVNMSKTSRAIERLYPREDGTLWVLSSRGSYDNADNEIATFDVFDRGGKFMRSITFEGEGDLNDDGLHLLKDRVFIVKGLQAAARAMRGAGGDDDEEVEDSPEPMSVICYGMDIVAKKK